jgi:hypothetical protein
VARALAAEGAHVILSGRNAEALAEVAADCAKGNATAFILPFEATDHPAGLAAAEQAWAWAAERSGGIDILFNNAGAGGTLATAGGLVFQGTIDGHFNAYDAANGKPLWSQDIYTAALAGPMTYEVDGEQYVAVGAGFGTLFYIIGGFALDEHLGVPENGRNLVYKLGGKAVLPKPNLTRIPMPQPPAQTASPAVVAANVLSCGGSSRARRQSVPALVQDGAGPVLLPHNPPTAPFGPTSRWRRRPTSRTSLSPPRVARTPTR